MSVLILNTMEQQCEEVLKLQQEITKKEKDTQIIYTNDMKISNCIGCNYCWLKTPGICTIKDDYEIILKKIISSDKIIFLTDTKLGFVTYQTKKLIDRIIPIATMYLKFVDGQMRHVERYNIHPNMGIVYTGEANKEYLNKWLYRVTLNFGGVSLGAYPLEKGSEVL